MSDSPGLVRQLLKAVVVSTWFFDTCDDSVLEDRVAIKQMEYIAYLLGELPKADRLQLIDELAGLTAVDTDPASREFLETFAFSMGLVEEEELKAAALSR